ncbi:hypothetical protein V8E54_006800 [Elaphomyces granulatus]
MFWLENVTLRVIEGFLRWYLDTHNIQYQSGFLVFARYWRIYWCDEVGKVFDYTSRRSMTMLVCTTLTDEYLGGKTQPSMNVDDDLYSTHHLIGVTDVWFPTVRCRHQRTLRKMMASTSARPGTLVESSRYMKHIDLYMVKHPEHPSCKVLLMRVKHRLNKSKKNKSFQDILEYAFLDDAFASERIKRLRDIWCLTDDPRSSAQYPYTLQKECPGDADL